METQEQLQSNCIKNFTIRKYKYLIICELKCIIFAKIKNNVMKKKSVTIICFVVCYLLLSIVTTLKAQLAFNKGSLLVSVSEGSTTATYSTSDVSNPQSPTLLHSCKIKGIRDPLIIEYGITRKWSIGITTGADIFAVNPAAYYGFKIADTCRTNATTSEFTFNTSYHFFVTERLDFSAFGSIGMFGVSFKGKASDDGTSYSYSSQGGIVRTGLQARYYFLKRLGVFGMVSSYCANSSSKDVKGNTSVNTTTTKINGSAFEAGLCYRFLN
jgi:hypothetical protein